MLKVSPKKLKKIDNVVRKLKTCSYIKYAVNINKIIIQVYRIEFWLIHNE